MQTQQLTDLVTRASQGDNDAMHALYAASYKSVYYFALSLVKNPEDAEDYTQEVFIKVYEKISTLKEPAAYYKWINRITVNQCNEMLRKRKNTGLLDTDNDEVFAHIADDNPNNMPDKAIDDADTRRIIFQIIDNLPESQHVCVMLHYYSEFPISMIAQVTNTNENTVKTRLSLARAKIRSALEHKEQRDGIRLYGVPLALGAVIQQTLGRLPMPTGSELRMWENITNSVQANALMNTPGYATSNTPDYAQNYASPYTPQNTPNYTSAYTPQNTPNYTNAAQQNSYQSVPQQPDYINRAPINYPQQGITQGAGRMARAGAKTGAKAIATIAGIPITAKTLGIIGSAVAAVIIGAVLITSNLESSDPEQDNPSRNVGSQTPDGSVGNNQPSNNNTPPRGMEETPISDFTYGAVAGGIEIKRYTGTSVRVRIPDTIEDLPVVSIGMTAFSDSGILEVYIPNTVTNIEPMAFAHNPGLTSITLPEGVTDIKRSAFHNSGLTSITIPDSVVNIGMTAFAGNKGLTHVIIGSGITSLGRGLDGEIQSPLVFDGCDSIMSVTYNGVTYRTEGRQFGELPEEIRSAFTYPTLTQGP